MVLLLHEDLANLFSHRIFSKRFTLRDAIAVITNGFIFIVEIVAEHVFRVFRCADRLRAGHRHFAEVIDLPRQGSIGGPVTIGGGRGPAVLAPAALPGNQPTLTIQSTLTFQNGGNYFYTFAASRNNSRADEVIANGVTIAGGATITVSGIILGRLPLGTTFTVISNTARPHLSPAPLPISTMARS
jgi:hypothetical protein